MQEINKPKPSTEVPIKSGSRFKSLKKVAKKIKRIDFMAPKYELQVDGDSTFKSKVGAVLTLILFGF